MFDWFKKRGEIVETDFSKSYIEAVKAQNRRQEEKRLENIENRLEFLEAEIKAEYDNLQAFVHKSGNLVMRKNNRDFVISKDEAMEIRSLLLKWQ